jgi:hypothetical protein
MVQLKQHSRRVCGDRDRIETAEDVRMTRIFQIQNSNFCPESGIRFTIGNLQDTTVTERNVIDERSQRAPRSVITTVAEKYDLTRGELQQMNN